MSNEGRDANEAGKQEASGLAAHPVFLFSCFIRGFSTAC
jgi:hypothetical protein